MEKGKREGEVQRQHDYSRQCGGMETGGVVKELQAALFPVCAKGSYISSFLQNTLKTNQVEINTDSRTLRPIAKLKEPRDLFALPKDLDCPQQAARWPAECQVLEERVHHIDTVASGPEFYYQPTGNEVQPKPVGEEAGQVVFQYYPVSAVNYFSRSSVGGSKYFMEACPCGDKVEGLRFESRFESGNLAKVVKITDSYYELYLRTDLYTNRHMQWFYFRVENMKTNTLYRFSLVNLSKGDSLYSVGMRPLLYSVKDAQLNDIGWRRCGNNIAYYKNECQGEEDQLPNYTLTFTLDFPHDDDRVYLAHCYPYTYTDLQDYLIRLQNHPIKSTYSKLRLLCRSLAGNNVYYLTITAPSLQDEPKKKRAIVVTARVHPGETPASWMMKGFMDFLTGDSLQARELRDKFIFKLVPMLNPDGVIVGNNRCSLTGRDLNRQYRTVIRETYPPVWHTKVMIRRLMEECGIEMYCDLHAHSRKHNIFIYGCENRRSPDRHLREQVFPLMLHKNAADKFCFESCKFRIQRSKEGTGRVVVWMMGVANSYTMEASFGGSGLGSRSGTHFNIHDYEQMGRHFCETLLDFCDQDPSKERLRSKIVNRLELEGSSADEPTNINLSDYSSDEGDTSSTSEEERPIDIMYCPAPDVPPSSPVLPRREHKRSQTAKERSPLMARKRSVLPVHCTNIDLAKDVSSDPNDAGTEIDSGEESPSWKYTSRCTKSEISPTRGAVSSKCTVGDMPPELIVQAVAALEGEKNDEPVVEPVTKENKETQTAQKEKPKKHCKRTANRLNNQQGGKVLPKPKTTTSLRKRVWTGIPCTCHDHIVATHWSSRGGGEISVLRACSQKLAGLRKLKDPAQRTKKIVQKLKQQTKCTSDSSGGEELKNYAPLPSPKYRRSVQRSPLRKPRKISSNESSSEEEQRTNLNEVKKLLQKKQKLQRWKTLSKLNTIKQTRDLTPRESTIKLQQRQSKPSLKWKFCKKSLMLEHTKVPVVQNENDFDILNVSASCSETDNKPVESQATETEPTADIPPPKASSGSTKKKKIRKHKGVMKKFQSVASASSAAAGFAKNASKVKKSSKTS